MTVDASKILAKLPNGLRNPLLASYHEITKNFAERRWEPAELNGGKFCEAVYTILDGGIRGNFPPRPAKPKDMVLACRHLEMTPADDTRPGDRSLRILIPRMLLPLYEIRNNRGVGHVGGDVDPNFLDATAVLAMASWILAELIRIFHNVSTKEAQEAVDTMIERQHPLIWEVEGIKRVLDPNMNKADQALLLLHSAPSWVSETDLRNWVEYSTLSMFRKAVLGPLHDSRLIEYDKSQRRARISPLGVNKVEQLIIRQ